MIDGKSLLAEIADADADLKLDQHAYINNTVGSKQINYPNIPYPNVPPHFSLSPPDAAVWYFSVSELEFGPMVRRRYIDSQLHKEVLYPDRHRHRLDKTEDVVGCPHTGTDSLIDCPSTLHLRAVFLPPKTYCTVCLSGVHYM